MPYTMVCACGKRFMAEDFRMGGGCPDCYPPDHPYGHTVGFVGTGPVDIDLEFSPDELDVIEYVKEGLRVGRKVYGPLVVDEDPRDFLNEAEQELRDSIVYMVGQIKKLRRMRERLEEMELLT